MTKRVKSWCGQADDDFPFSQRMAKDNCVRLYLEKNYRKGQEIFLFSKTCRPDLMLTQPPITLVPPKCAVVTNEWSCTTISTTCLREWEENTSIILNISFLFILYTFLPIHLLSVHCHSCAIIPHCISPTTHILSPYLISHHFPPSSAYCSTLKRKVTNFPKGWYTFTNPWGDILPQNHCT